MWIPLWYLVYLHTPMRYGKQCFCRTNYFHGVGMLKKNANIVCWPLWFIIYMCIRIRFVYRSTSFNWLRNKQPKINTLNVCVPMYTMMLRQGQGQFNIRLILSLTPSLQLLETPRFSFSPCILKLFKSLIIIIYKLRICDSWLLSRCEIFTGTRTSRHYCYHI